MATGRPTEDGTRLPRMGGRAGEGLANHHFCFELRRSKINALIIISFFLFLLACDSSGGIFLRTCTSSLLDVECVVFHNHPFFFLASEDSSWEFLLIYIGLAAKIFFSFSFFFFFLRCRSSRGEGGCGRVGSGRFFFDLCLTRARNPTMRKKKKCDHACTRCEYWGSKERLVLVLSRRYFQFLL